MGKSKRSHILGCDGVISTVRAECRCELEEPSRTQVGERVGGIRIKLRQPRFVQVAVKRETTKRDTPRTEHLLSALRMETDDGKGGGREKIRVFDLRGTASPCTLPRPSRVLNPFSIARTPRYDGRCSLYERERERKGEERRGEERSFPPLGCQDDPSHAPQNLKNCHRRTWTMNALSGKRPVDRATPIFFCMQGMPRHVYPRLVSDKIYSINATMISQIPLCIYIKLLCFSSLSLSLSY